MRRLKGDAQRSEDGGPQPPASGVMPVSGHDRQPPSSAHLQRHKALHDRYLPIVRRIAMKLVRRLPRHITLDDLIGAGWLGLVEALRRRSAFLDDEQFDAYAAYRVRGAMLDYLRSLDPLTRKMRGASRRITLAIKDLTARFRRAPHEDEIAEALGVDLEDYRALLNQVAQRDQVRIELHESTGAHASETAPDVIASRMQVADQISIAVRLMSERTQLLMALYYLEDCSFREVAEVLGVTEARVCQLHSEAIHRIRAHLESRDVG
jgi:RNA polymerase sigma factor for flagellar operon FliA